MSEVADADVLEAGRGGRCCWRRVGVKWGVLGEVTDGLAEGKMGVRRSGWIEDVEDVLGRGEMGIPAYSMGGGIEGVLKAPGWLESCCTSTPSSRATRSSRRFSHPKSCIEASERLGADLDDDSPAVGLFFSPGSASPKMIDRMASSIPMKSRMNFLVTLCQNDSSSVDGEVPSDTEPSLWVNLATDFSSNPTLTSSFSRVEAG